MPRTHTVQVDRAGGIVAPVEDDNACSRCHVRSVNASERAAGRARNRPLFNAPLPRAAPGSLPLLRRNTRSLPLSSPFRALTPESDIWRENGPRSRPVWSLVGNLSTAGKLLALTYEPRLAEPRLLSQSISY